MPWGSAFGLKQHWMVLSNIQDWVGCARPLVYYNVLDLLCLAECGLRDSLMLIALRWVSTNARGGAESRMAELCRLKERRRAADDDSKVHGVVHAR